MAKKFNQSAMDELMGGLASDSSEGVQSSIAKRRGRPKGNLTKERFCIMVDPEVAKKVRAIVRKEDLAISDIIELGIKMAIDAYEKKHGEIVCNKTASDINEVFGL